MASGGCSKIAMAVLDQALELPIALGKRVPVAMDNSIRFDDHRDHFPLVPAFYHGLRIATRRRTIPPAEQGARIKLIVSTGFRIK
jgi:hypothetical protein